MYAFPVRRFLQAEVLGGHHIGRLFWLHVIRRLLFDTEGSGLIAHYRISQALEFRGWLSMAGMVRRRGERRFHCYLHRASFFGEGLRIPHPVGIIVGRGVKAGKRCALYQNVTLGGVRPNDWRDSLHPVLGDDVLISSGAVVLGRISVGDGAKIGAGAVVVKDVPAHHSAVGVPARLIASPA